MKTLLLLAGRSTRFWPLTDKALFPLCGKTLLEHQVERLQQAGATDITLVGGAHNLEAARSLFPKFAVIEQEDLDRGMQGALLSALPSCGTNPVFVVSSNDVIETSGFQSLLATPMKGLGGALLAQRVKRYFPGGYLSVERDGRVTGIVEKPGEGKEPSDLVTIVAHVHSNASVVLEALQSIDGSAGDAYERCLTKLCGEYRYVAVPYEGLWQPVKYPWHVLGVLSMLLKDIDAPHIHPGATVHPSAVIEGNVVLSEGVRVLAHATVRGPCFIGKGTVVANNALVRDSSVGDRCVVGYATEVARSVLANDVWTHMSYVGDSIIGSNVSLGGGTKTGNLRLDEGEVFSDVQGQKVSTSLTKFGAVIGDNIRIGIQVGTNPGVKIGANSFVSGGAFLQQDVPDSSFVSLKDGALTIRPNRSPVPSATIRSAARQGLSGKSGA